MSAWSVGIYAMEHILIYIGEARIGLKEIEAAIRILELFDDAVGGRRSSWRTSSTSITSQIWPRTRLIGL